LSLEIIEKKPSILKDKINDEDYFNYSNVVIPFSDFFHKIEFLDVYSGGENIPFEERDLEYKKILLTEFL
jgi:hypothetical protein